MTEYRWKTTEQDQTLPAPLPRLLKEWQAGWLWVAATAIGWLLGFLFYVLTGELFVGAVAMGLLSGWSQMLILTVQRVRVGWLWVLNTTIAFVTWGMALPAFGSVGLWSGFALGVLLGLLQWLGLRRHVESAWRWLLANVGAWIIALGVYAPLTDASGTWLIGIGTGGLIAGGILAGVMMWLLRRPVIEAPAEAPLKDDYQSS